MPQGCSADSWERWSPLGLPGVDGWARLPWASHIQWGRTLPAWISLKPASRIKSKLVGLAVTLGLPIERALLRQLAAPDAEQPEEVERALDSAVWISLLYLVLYFVIGASAFALSIVRPEVPELIGNAAWVWLGTLVSSGYAFFGVN